jgi:hypothetical protein
MPETGSGTFETYPPVLSVSVNWGRPQVAVIQPNRRKCPKCDIPVAAGSYTPRHF